MINRIEKRLKNYIRTKEINEYKKSVASQITKASLSSDSILIGNAIPKSGTYLLNTIFRYLNKWSETKIHLLDNHTFQFYDNKDTASFALNPIEMLNLMKPGQLCAAHFHYSDQLAEYFNNKKHIKHIFMYRDPRDTFVSYMNFMTYSKNASHWWRPRKEQEFMFDFFSNDEDRLSYVIPKIMERENWNGYASWLSDPNTYSIRFEYLYSELLNCKNGEMGETIRLLLKFLNIDDTQIDPKDMAMSVLGNGYTSSGVVDKIGQFKRVFKPCHYRLIDTPSMDIVLDKFGYEKYNR